MKFELDASQESREMPQYKKKHPYAFKIINAEERLSKAGNEMIVIECLVDLGAKDIKVRDYLLKASSWKAEILHESMKLDVEVTVKDGKKIIDIKPRDLLNKEGTLTLKQNPKTEYPQVDAYIYKKDTNQTEKANKEPNDVLPF